MFFSFISSSSNRELFCVEVSSLTVIPQTYIVQMTTSNIPPTRLTASITYIGTDCNSYEETNGTAIRVRWTYNGSYVSGYIITITAIGVNIVKEINNNTVTSYVVDGIIPERHYTIEVRRYFTLVGAAGSTTARLSGM